MNHLIYAKRCECGAVTIQILSQQWSMSYKIFKEKFPEIKLAKGKWYCCDYCTSNWGIDLCACGSGKKFEKCKEGFPECGTPMQDIEMLKEMLNERIG